MLKRILILGLAAVALALAVPAIGTQIGLGTTEAQAQVPPHTGEEPEAPDPGEEPEAPDTGEEPEAPDTGEEPEAPDPGEEPDEPEAPEAPDQSAQPAPAPAPPAATVAPALSEDDEGDDDEEEEAVPSPQGRENGQTGSNPSDENVGAVLGKHRRSTALPRVRVWENTAFVSDGTDTGAIPQGGIHAGGGGTADDGAVWALLLGSVALMLVLTGGSLALRRRAHGS